MLTAKKAGVEKRVAAYRGTSDHFQKSILRILYNRWVHRLVYRNATNIVANSKVAFDYFFPGLEGQDRRFSVIYNKINPHEYISEPGSLRKQFLIPQTSYVIGHTGCFNPAKNHSTILDVAEIIVKRHKDIYFILCGNGVEKGIKEVLEKKGISHRVLAFDNRSDIPRFLNTMDCYFFPSVTEGQPNALIEAMIMGLPFVASDIQPIRETVGDKYPLYPASDINVLVAALEDRYRARESRNSVQQTEMIERFEYKKRFDEFYMVLTGL